MELTRNRCSKWYSAPFLLVIILFFSSTLVQAQWTVVTPPAVSDSWELYGVHFTSATEGWAAGYDDINLKGVLLHYQDGTWTSVTPPDVSGHWAMVGIHFTSATEGWAVGVDYINLRGVLLHYQNGTWTSVTPPDVNATWYLEAVHFTSATEGWAVGVDWTNVKGVLLRYQNGTWTSVTPPDVNDAWYLYVVHFTSATEGWAAGYGSTSGGALLHYQDGTWTSVPSPYVSKWWAVGGIHFTSANEGWAAGIDYTNMSPVLLHYQNGTWTSVTPPYVSGDWAVGGIHFTSANEGWTVGVDYINLRGVLLHYQNGTWTSVTPPYVSGNWILIGVHFTSATEGWAVGIDYTASSIYKGILLHYFVPVASHVLTVGKDGDGTGKITSNPGGIDCGSDCTEVYMEGQSVTLTAAADSGSVFAGWRGGGCSGTGTCVVRMNPDVTVIATFNLSGPSHLLTVGKDGDGNGRITSNPIGIYCGADCTQVYPEGQSVTLTAAADSGSVFAGWRGGGCSGTGTCVVLMNPDVTVIATFNLSGPSHLLTVGTDGDGTGKITSNPAGIDCGSDCTQAFDTGTVVTLTAQADPGSVFGGWTGGGCSGTESCTVSTILDVTVTATFDLSGPLSVTKGTIGTQITITDSGFGMKKGKVRIGDAATKVLSWGDTSITVEIKKPLPPGLYTLVAHRKEPKGAAPITYQGAFTMRAPQVLSVTPKSGSPGEERQISGNYFGIKKGKVYLSGTKCKIRSWTMDPARGGSNVTFIVPKNVAPGDHDVTLTNKVGSHTLASGFTVP